MDDVNETAQRIKTRLGNLDETIKEKEAIDTDANRRIKRTMHAMAQKKVRDVSLPPMTNCNIMKLGTGSAQRCVLLHFVVVRSTLKLDQFMDTMGHYQDVQNK